MSSWFYHFLQRMRLRWLLAAALIVTALFALAYGLLDVFAPGNGLRPPDWEKNVEWFDYLYFSVVTEGTLGYGDFVPQGLSRVLACVQALVGILLGGMLVAKITSAAINRLTEIQNAVSGCWVDIVTFPDGQVWLGVVEFVADQGSILFRGVNYNPDGQMQHNFSCRLLYHDWPQHLTFRYEEAHERRLSGHGQTSVLFSDWRRNRPQCFRATIEDREKGNRITAVGWRVVSRRWVRQLRAVDRPDSLIRDLYRHYGKHLNTDLGSE